MLEGLVMVSIPKPWQKERLAAEDTNGGPVPPVVG